MTSDSGDLPRRSNARSEIAVAALLLGAAGCAAGFVFLYALEPRHLTQLLGLALGSAFALLAAASIMAGKSLVPQDEHAAAYPNQDPAAQAEVVQIVEEAKAGITRRRLLAAAGAGAATAVGAALITPALSLGPAFDTDRLRATPWRRGRRLVDAAGRPFRAREIELDAFYTAYPEGAGRDELGAPVIVIRLDPARLDLPPEREGWAPDGVLAYSKICTHAGCAVSEYRTPLFQPTAPGPALVCPCHYSTFDPATGGTVLFGPAGRPLPQLPLVVDDGGHLHAAGDLSAPPGPSWWGVREDG